MRRINAVLLFAAGSAAVSLSAYGAQPVPDPRLDPYYNAIAIASIHRSVELERAVPAVAPRQKPAVREGEMREVRDAVYVERALLPRGGLEDERGVIRVYPRDR